MTAHHILNDSLHFFFRAVCSRARLEVFIKIKNYFHVGGILAEESVHLSNSLPGWSGSLIFFPVRADLDSFSKFSGVCSVNTILCLLQIPCCGSEVQLTV